MLRAGTSCITRLLEPIISQCLLKCRFLLLAASEPVRGKKKQKCLELPVLFTFFLSVTRKTKSTVETQTERWRNKTQATLVLLFAMSKATLQRQLGPLTMIAPSYQQQFKQILKCGYESDKRFPHPILESMKTKSE